MNERIRGLTEQTGESIPEFHVGDWNIPNEFIQKFAELIVKECCDVLYDNEMGGYQVNYVLKEHFGIK